MSLTTEIVGESVVVRAGRRIDGASARPIKQELRKLFKKGYKQYVFDLEDVEFLDSSGMGMLVSILREVSPKGGDVKLTRIRPVVAKVLEITRLDQVFDILPDLDQALAAMKTAPGGKR